MYSWIFFLLLTNTLFFILIPVPHSRLKSPRCLLVPALMAAMVRYSNIRFEAIHLKKEIAIQ